MRNVSAHQTRAAGGRIGAEVATYITGRKIQRAKAGDLQMSKVLTNTAALAENFFSSGANRRRFCVKTKITINTSGQIQKRIAERSTGSKCEESVPSKFGTWPDPGRLEDELIGFNAFRATLVRHLPRYFLPRH